MDCCSLLAKGLITCESPEDNSRLLGEVQRAAWCVHESAAEIAAFRCWREKPVGVASALHKQQPVCHLLTLQLCLCSTQGFTCLKHRAALSLWGQMIKLLQLHVLYLVDPKAEWCCSSELTHTDSSHAFKKIKKEKKKYFPPAAAWQQEAAHSRWSVHGIWRSETWEDCKWGHVQGS